LKGAQVENLRQREKYKLKAQVENLRQRGRRDLNGTS